MRWLRPSATVLTVGILALAACTRNVAESPSTSPVAQSTPRPTPVAGTPTAILPPGSQLCIETIVIQDAKAIPDTLTVKRPCVVLFTNRSDSVEQIQGHDFLLGEMGKDQSWAHTYTQPGVFDYFSTKNPAIRGKIIVQP